MNDRGRRTLTDTDLNQQTLQDLAHQRERLTNLVQNATRLSQQAEDAEPLMSGELYDTLRKFSQNDLGNLKQFQEDLMNRGVMSRDLNDQLKRMEEESGAKSLDLTRELLRQGLPQEADLAEQRARAAINDLRRGVERAAESVVGDDAESLRQAREGLDRSVQQLEREISRAGGGTTNDSAGSARSASSPGGQPQDRREGLASNPPSPNQQSETGTQAGRPGDQPGQQTGADGGQGSRERSANTADNRGRGSLSDNPARRGGRLTTRSADGGSDGGYLDRLFDDRSGQWTGPITGGDYGPWSDGLREVEELIEAPTLRNAVAQARERARQMRQDYKRAQKKPDWATLRLNVVNPLVEVSKQIDEELARREPRNDLVPIDRDPVPGRYSELVRRYYEQLGKGNASGAGLSPTKASGQAGRLPH